MTQDKLIIPEKIRVGFQNRSDTFTGRLGFVVYIDNKGNLRQERSWNGWRDKKIEPLEFDNEPTTGFVLNKKVGDYSSRWGGRRAWIRIYDPRGFEFEISVENLLFVLEHTSAIQGKGLEGEFVLAWGGSGSNCKVMLLPTCSEDYRESSNYTELQTKKVTKKDMVEGAVYRSKDNQDYIYLGRHAYHELTGSPYYQDGRQVSSTKLHVFVSVDGKSTYWTQKGFTNLAVRLSEEPSPLYADEFDKFMNSFHGSPLAEIIGTPAAIDFTDYYRSRGHYYLKKGGWFYRAEIKYDYGHGAWSYGYGRSHPKREPTWQIRESADPVRLTTDGRIVWPPDLGRSFIDISEEQLRSMEFYTLSLKNERGAVSAV
ncbi:MAG: hypothetical protein AB7L09_02520 [Nitrospira sp.]